MINRRVFGLGLLAALPLTITHIGIASAQTAHESGNDEDRRNRRMIASRAFGGGPIPIPVAPEFGGLFTHVEQPTIFFLLRSDVSGDIRLTLQRAGEAHPAFSISLGRVWPAGLHAVRFADLETRLSPATRVDWTLELRRIGREPIQTGATIIYRRAPALSTNLAGLPAPSAIRVLQKDGYWYDAFLCATQAPADERETLTRSLLTDINIGPA